MPAIAQWIKEKYNEIYKVFLFIVTILLVVYFFPKEASFKYEYQKNKPWYNEDLIAPYDIPVYPTEQEIEEKKNEFIAHQKLYFTLNNDVFETRKIAFHEKLEENWTDFFTTYLENIQKKIFKPVRSPNEKEFKKTIQQKGLELLKKIYSKGIINYDFEDKLGEDLVFYVKKDNFYAAYTQNDVFTLKQAYEFLVNELANKNPEEIFLLNVLDDILTTNHPNIVFSETDTERVLQQELKKAYALTETILEGQSMIKKGDIVDDYKYRLLHSFEKKFKSEQLSDQKKHWITLGQFILVTLIIGCLAMYLIFFRKEIYTNSKNLFFILLTISSAVIVCSLIVQYNVLSVYLVPLCLVPLIIRSFFDTRTAFFAHLIVILLLGFIVTNGFNFMFMQLVAGMVGIYGFVNFKNRSQLFYTTIAIISTYFVAHLALGIISEGGLKIDWITLTWFSISGGLTLLVYPLIYILEKLFGFTSDISLLELADTNNPLLRELAKKAPGTFQHSMQVANLAEEAIHTIGGNALLIRTAALYHDIGKLKNPMYFIENQHTGVNPHDDLAYEDSASIIINHVTDGINLAKKHKLPESIVDFIRTHHGTSSTGYFFNRYVQEHPDDEDAIKLFQYPGPIPFDKETAVLMMADAVEAASRSIKEPNAKKIDVLVDHIIGKQLEEGQFNNASITLKEISKIKKLFKKMLMNIYHIRIEYN